MEAHDVLIALGETLGFPGGTTDLTLLHRTMQNQVRRKDGDLDSGLGQHLVVWGHICSILIATGEGGRMTGSEIGMVGLRPRSAADGKPVAAMTEERDRPTWAR